MSEANGSGKPGEKGEPHLIEQPHGGALLSGGTPGQKGGTGRPPSELRRRMRGSLDERLQVAEEIADDETAKDTDRLRALDFLAKYGLGTKIEHTGVDDGPIEFDSAATARERIAGRLARLAPPK